jgi:rhamnosyltransferase
VAAVFGRQIPRPDCQAAFAHDYERCFGPQRRSEKWDHFFSMASSGIRKDIWAQRGFNEKMHYSEDDEYTRWCTAQGYRIEYVPDSIVMHSHNYTLPQVWRRCFGEGKALAAVWPRSPAGWRWPRAVLLGWAADVARDFGFCCRHRCLNEWSHAARVRWVQRQARRAGFREGWAQFRSAGPSAAPLPPTWAVPLHRSADS